MIDIAVLATVCAPYRDGVRADELALKICDVDSAARSDAFAFAFFSEVTEPLQRRFVARWCFNEPAVALFSRRVGYTLPLSIPGKASSGSKGRDRANHQRDHP